MKRQSIVKDMNEIEMTRLSHEKKGKTMSFALSILCAYAFIVIAGNMGITDIHELLIPIAVILAGGIAGIRE